MREKIVRLLKEEKNETGYIRRFIAYGIDWYVGSVVASLPIIMIYMSLHQEAKIIPQNLTIFSYPMNIIAGTLSVSLALCYYVMIPSLLWPGQTLGKKLLGLKMVDTSFVPATRKQIVLRQAVVIFLIEGSLYTSSNILHQMVSIITKINITTIYAYIGIIITILSVLLLLLLPGRKALHDIISGTRVVEIHSKQYHMKQQKIKKQERKALRLAKM